MNEDRLRDHFEEEYPEDEKDINAVVEKAMQLDQSSDWEAVSDQEFTANFIVGKVCMAQRDLISSWNWWMGNLDYVNPDRDFRKYQIG